MVEIMQKKKIVYITGSRADFGRAYYTLNAIRKEGSFRLYIIATSMHLSPEFGYTLREIQKDFKIYDTVDSLLSSDTLGSMVKSFSLELMGITQILEKLKPDAIIVLGDRGEMLAAAISAAHLNIPVYHIGGGYFSGSIDNRIRDSITIFSDFHLVANEKCRNRVINIGASPSKVYIVGAPDLEPIVKKDFSKPREVSTEFNIDLDKPLLLVSYHPVTEEYQDIERQAMKVYKSILKFKIQTIIIHPNADAGGKKIAKILKKYSKHPFIQTYTHIPYKLYLGLMNIASVMVGNSSAGIIEAPSFGLPVVNIGSRQKNREKADNIIDVKCDIDEITNAIETALYDEKFIQRAKNCKNPYGDGKTSERIIEILKNNFGEIQ